MLLRKPWVYRWKNFRRLFRENPTGSRPEGHGRGGCVCSLMEPFAGPNVGRALSLAPADNAAFFGLVGSMYAMVDFQELVWNDRPLTPASGRAGGSPGLGHQ